MWVMNQIIFICSWASYSVSNIELKCPSSVESLEFFNGIEGLFWMCATSQIETRIPHSQEAIQDGRPLSLLNQSIISSSYSTPNDGGKCARDRRKSRALLRRRRTLFFVDSVKTPPLRRYWHHLFLPSKRKHSLIPMFILLRISVVSIYLTLHQKIPLTINPLLFSIESNTVSPFLPYSFSFDTGIVLWPCRFTSIHSCIISSLDDLDDTFDLFSTHRML